MRKRYFVFLIIAYIMLGLSGCAIGEASGNNNEEFKNPYRADFICEYHVIENGVCTQCGNKIEDSQGLDFILDETATYYICSGMGSCMDTQVIIPTQYNNKPVREINEFAFMDCEKIRSVVLPAGITYIGEGAFQFCRKLQHVVVPDTVLSIGSGAFKYCAQLNEIILPNKITEIPDELFEGCVRLKKVVLQGSILEIGNNSFYNCQSLDNFIFPEGLELIGKQAFGRCSRLNEIVLSQSITSIGQSAFEQCTNVSSVIYKGTVADWLNIDFEYGANPMNVCDRIYIDDNLLSEVIRIPDQIIVLKEYSFQGCNSVQSMIVHRNLLSQDVPPRFFADCTSLTDLYIEATEEEAKEFVKNISFKGSIHYLHGDNIK